MCGSAGRPSWELGSVPYWVESAGRVLFRTVREVDVKGRGKE